MMKAVANQLGALLITLSPEMIKDHFLDKIEATRLIHMIFTVARDDRFGPVLLNIDECEQFFQSSTGKQVDRSGPVRFQKDLLIYKNQAIEKKDRVIIIGTTAHPELLDPKTIKYKGPGGKPEKQGMFEKYLFFPPPNYVDRLLLWKSFVNEDSGEKVGDGERVPSKLHRKCIDFSVLASKSEGYTAGRIRRSVELARKLSDTSETGSGSNQSRALSEKVLLAQLESFDAVGNEDRMRFVNFAKAMEQKSKSAAGTGDKKEKAGGKAKASK
uniref:ATPase AAA-type core domain-containing protein n=1 Tax=Minutocellus polymorphus TaxID=265543 RepID=A0A7S0AWZ5_9STRA